MSDSILIVTNPEVGIGYKLAGVEVFEATTGIEVFTFLKNAVKNPNIGLIGIDEEFYDSLDSRFLETIKKRGKPLILSIQSIEKMEKGTISVDDYIKHLTLKTAGVIVNVDKES
ncbi:MAG: V-type ATP synthase subunit F [Candidatus Hodarchaeota archaeon]